MIDFNDEPGWQVICIRCTHAFVVSDRAKPRDGDPYTCPACREIVEDEFEIDRQD